MKLLIAGGREYTDLQGMLEALKHIDNTFNNVFPSSNAEVEIVSGTARGADVTGEQLALTLGCSVKQFPADWNTFGKRAGYIRNTTMADYLANEKSKTDGYENTAVIFWDGMSKGTQNMIKLLIKYKISHFIALYDATTLKITDIDRY